MATGEPSKLNKQSKIIDNEYEIVYKNKVDVNNILNEKQHINFIDISGIPNIEINSLYYGDNYEALKDLLYNRNLKGKIDLIYIDPPYAKRANFSTRKQELAYQDILIGANYLEFLRKRLILMRELLSKQGSIYIHLDEVMAFEIKLIMDEVFGKKNYKNWIVRKKSNPKNSTSKKYGNIADYIMFYTKSNDYIFNQPYENWEEENSYKEYNCVEEETGRRFKKVPIHAPGIRNGETAKEWMGMLPPPGKHWQYKPSTLDEMNERGEIFWSSNGNPRRKIYLDNSKGKKVQDIWLDFKDAHNQNVKITGYPTEKNMELLERIISVSSNEGSIVLDAFNGSGTTISVANKLNRKWIGIDNSSLSIDTTLNRIRNGMEIMGDFSNKKNTSNQLELFSDNEKFEEFNLLVKDTTDLELIDNWKSMLINP